MAFPCKPRAEQDGSEEGKDSSRYGVTHDRVCHTSIRQLSKIKLSIVLSRGGLQEHDRQPRRGLAEPLRSLGAFHHACSWYLFDFDRQYVLPLADKPSFTKVEARHPEVFPAVLGYRDHYAELSVINADQDPSVPFEHVHPEYRRHPALHRQIQACLNTYTFRRMQCRLAP